MRLAYIDPQSYHGLAKYDAGYLLGLEACGIEERITFYCSDLFEQELSENIDVKAIFSYNRKRFSVTKLLSYLYSMLRLILDARSKPASIYHFQWFKFPLADLFFVRLLRRVSKARIVYTAHNVVPHNAESGRHRALGKLYHEVDLVVVHHADTGKEISERFSVPPEQFAVLRPGPTDLEAAGEEEHTGEVDDFVRDRDLTFMFFGRGSWYKGLDLLLDAWIAAERDFEGRVGLMVIGSIDEGLRDAAQTAIAQSDGSLLVIDQHVSEGDLLHAVNACDVVILPHREISQSGVLLSVLSLQKPILVADRPGLVEPLGIANVGWRFDGSTSDLGRQLTMLADQPGRVTGVREDAESWRTVLAAYDWKSVARKGIDVYKKLLATESAADWHSS